MRDEPITPDPAELSPVQPLQYETSPIDSAKPMFRATMGVGVTLGLLYVLSLPTLPWWDSSMRQALGRLGMPVNWLIAFSAGEHFSGVGLLFMSAVALYGRPAARKWFIAALVLLMCCNLAYQVVNREIWLMLTNPVSSWVTNNPAWAVFCAFVEVVSPLAWPILMLVLVTRPILKPLFHRPLP